jgi:hypothetical protein
MRLLPGCPEDDVSLLVVHLTAPTALPVAAPRPPLATAS